MSEENDKNMGSRLPFSPPPISRAPIEAPRPIESSDRKTISSKKQLRRAKKNRKSAVSVRNLFTGLFLLIVTVSAATAIMFPGMLTKIVSGEFIVNQETCKVTEINSSMFFDSSCGKFEWDKEGQPGSPSAKLKKGKTYTFESVGLRIEPAQVFPYVKNYEEVKGKKR